MPHKQSHWYLRRGEPNHNRICKLYPLANTPFTASAKAGGDAAEACVVCSKAAISVRDKKLIRFDLRYLFIAIMVAARPMTPPIVRNWIMALVATAAGMISTYSSLIVCKWDIQHWSRFSTGNGVITSRQAILTPTPNTSIAWYPYWAFLILVVIGEVLSKASPTVWITKPPSSRYMGGTFISPATPAAMMEPIGLKTANGKRRIPAPRADTPLTVWNRRGIWLTATVKGAPVRNIFLGLCEHMFQLQEYRTSHKVTRVVQYEPGFA